MCSSDLSNKAKINLRKSFRRFPKISELEIVKSFTPKKGTVVFFQSTPNSYHGVKRFIERNCSKRLVDKPSLMLLLPLLLRSSTKGPFHFRAPRLEVQYMRDHPKKLQVDQGCQIRD